MWRCSYFIWRALFYICKVCLYYFFVKKKKVYMNNKDLKIPKILKAFFIFFCKNEQFTTDYTKTKNVILLRC